MMPNFANVECSSRDELMGCTARSVEAFRLNKHWQSQWHITPNFVVENNLGTAHEEP
jgi:hypothetical protein